MDFFNSRRLPPAVLAIGDIAWKVLSTWSNIDFFMSLREEKFRLVLRLFLDWGWLALLAVAAIWFLMEPRNRQGAGAGWVVTVGILAFMYGVLITINASHAFPRILTEWGRSATGCWASLDTYPLRSFSKSHDLILTCGVRDPARDILDDDRITFSSPFVITGQQVTIATDYATNTKQIIANNPRPDLVIWYEAILLPKGLDRSRVKRLSDVPKENGKILREQYFQ